MVTMKCKTYKIGKYDITLIKQYDFATIIQTHQTFK